MPVRLVPPRWGPQETRFVPCSMRYRSAKADPGRRFHALRDKVYRRDVLWRALRCAVMMVRRVSMEPPWLMSRSMALTGFWARWPRI